MKTNEQLIAELIAPHQSDLKWYRGKLKYFLQCKSHDTSGIEEIRNQIDYLEAKITTMEIALKAYIARNG